ncbi:hypothetical protein CEXT_133351 [Caerostris extrusa]|uniref:Uncharacterized protein n=1 Tax=Caerostris extrusa TaxID=172846 RepID=A0AAV4YEL8_CAEEX|nr:hypothetical protein CEXT_133351 [Caerostris extrusa]
MGKKRENISLNMGPTITYHVYRRQAQSFPFIELFRYQEEQHPSNRLEFRWSLKVKRIGAAGLSYLSSARLSVRQPLTGKSGLLPLALSFRLFVVCSDLHSPAGITKEANMQFTEKGPCLGLPL